MSTTPREVLERYLRLGMKGDRAAQAALFAPDAVVEFPFATPGTPARFEGNDAIRVMFARLTSGASATNMHVNEEKTVLDLHTTTDPEVVIAEISVHVDLPDNAHLTLPYIQLWRIRDGRILLFRDYWAATTAAFVANALA